MNIGRSRTKIWLALPVLALMLAAIAMSGLQHGTAYAAVDAEGGSGALTGQADGEELRLGTQELGYAGAADVGAGGAPIYAASRGGMKVVWSALLTVGMATDGRTTIHGYVPGGSEPIGDLDDTAFSDRGVDYAILTLIHQQTGSVNQVVLEVDAGLPDDLIFEVDGERFAVSDSLALGLHENIHVWRLDSGIGWSEGDSMAVKLMRPRPYNPCGDEQE